MLAYFQGWILLQAILAITAWRYLGGWLGAVAALAGSMFYTIWNAV
jgi:hypothetical protein